MGIARGQPRSRELTDSYLLFLSLDYPGMACDAVRTHNYCGKQRGSVRFVDSLRTRIVTVCVVRKLYRMRRHDIVGIQRQGVCERRRKNLNMVMKSNN